MKRKNILTIIALIGVGILIYATRQTLLDALELAKTTNWVVLIVGALILKAIGFSALARYYYEILKVFGHSVPRKIRFQSVIAVTFVNLIVPTGGISGGTWLAYRFKNYGVPIAITSLLQVGRYVLSLVGFAILLLTSLIILLLVGGISSYGIVISFALLAVVSTFIVGLFYVMHREGRVHSTVARFVKIMNWIVMLLSFGAKKKKFSSSEIDEQIQAFHDHYVRLLSDRYLIIRPLISVTVFTIAEIGVLYLAFASLSQFVNPATSVVAYGAATFIASFIALLPAAVGVYEAIMASVFSSLGIAPALSVSATLLFRATHLVITLPIGFYFFRKLGGKGESTA